MGIQRKIDKLGYKKNSPFKNEPSLVINSNQITMKDVPHKILGVDNLGNQQMMYPDNDYMFPGQFVTEYPIMQNGGQYLSPAKWNQLQTSQGLMASPGYSASTVNKSNSYLEFYDPKQFMPVPDASGIISWSKIGDPNYKYTDETNSPFIKYTPPKQSVTQQKTYIENDPNRKPFQFGPNQNFDPNTGNYFTGPTPLADGSNIIKPLTKKMGGSLNKFMTNYLRQFGGAQGNEQIQGQSIDQFLEEKNNEFVDFLADKAGEFLYRDEVKDFMRKGGQSKAQMGTQVQLDDPNDPLKPRVQNNFYNQQQGPFGPYGQNQNVPDYMSGNNDQYNMPEMVDYTQAANPYQFGATQDGVDPNQVSYDVDMQNRLRELNSQGNQSGNKFNGNQIADVAMAGVQTLNNFFNKAQNYKHQQWLDQQKAISNTSPAFYGNKGNYDVNQGNFKVNQMTPSFQVGGNFANGNKRKLEQWPVETNSIPYNYAQGKLLNKNDSMMFDIGYIDVNRAANNIDPVMQEYAKYDVPDIYRGDNDPAALGRMAAHLDNGNVYDQTSMNTMSKEYYKSHPKEYNKNKIDAIISRQTAGMSGTQKEATMRALLENLKSPAQKEQDWINYQKNDKSAPVKEFNPNNYKMGGSYELDRKTIDRLVSEGYNIEFLD